MQSGTPAGMATAALTLLCALTLTADDTVGPVQEQLNRARERAMNFLRNSQADDGSWTTPNTPGITALAVTALQRSAASVDDPAVKKALRHLQSHVKPDGGIYFIDSNHRNYETCIAIMAFDAANVDGRYEMLLAKARAFLRELQWDRGEGLESSDPAYGGAGYGNHQRPDLSNTQFLIEALRTGVVADDAAIQKALIFVSRSQNLESGNNATAFASKINDGGFYYTPAAGGASQAGETPDGGLRSYGSMTYAGLKSMIYAGLNRDDERVRAALEWVRRFYTLDENPGMGAQGLYYYYHTFAKALAALEEPYLTAADQQRHDWRRELATKLFVLQKPNGSWVNRVDRWYEGDPNLSTAYSLLALSYCKPSAKSGGKK